MNSNTLFFILRDHGLVFVKQQGAWLNIPTVEIDVAYCTSMKTLEDMANRKALIVDDEKDTCFLLSIILKQQNFETSAVHSLADASEALTQDEPSIIFLDNNLGDGTGVDYLPELRKKYPGVKVILITAFDTLPVRTKAFKNGADYFVGKPFDKQEITSALKAVF